MYYRAVTGFIDSKDPERRRYSAGEAYPRAGYTPGEDRIKELSGRSNSRGRAVIEKAPDMAADAPAGAASTPKASVIDKRPAKSVRKPERA